MALVKFVVEQLRLYLSPKLGRRYSVELITTSFLWQLTSTALYQKLRWLVIVPSVSRLRQISSGINVETGKLDVAHTKQRICNLSPTERKVVLIVNEVYITQRIEYCNGQFHSLTKVGIPAKTVLAFMAKSIIGKYKDVICLTEINKLYSGSLREWFLRVMEEIKDYFDSLVFTVNTI